MDTLAAYEKVNQQTQETLVKAHALMVKKIAYHLLGRLPHIVQFDDLIQAGMLGLLEALRNYDAAKGASFETYAGIRIRGHMLDEVRRHDWVPRSVHRNARIIAEAVKKVENHTGRDAKDHEIARELKLSLVDYYAMLKDSVGCQLYRFDDLGVTEDVIKDNDENITTEPYRKILHDDLLKQLSLIIKQLPQKEQLVLSLYYEQDLNLKEIGGVIGVSESRISQIHSQAILRIKSRL